LMRFYARIPERLLFQSFPIFSSAIRHEVGMLHASLAFQCPSPNDSAINSSPEAQAYLDRAEQAAGTYLWV
jgi:hypothetical protein